LYHLGLNVIIWDETLSSGTNVIIWDYMLSSGMITHPFFIFPENFTHSLTSSVSPAENLCELQPSASCIEIFFRRKMPSHNRRYVLVLVK
jgi:hypothetical protein